MTTLSAVFGGRLISRTLRGYLVLFGGFLVHLTLGTGFTYGNMSPYLTSYLRVRSDNEDVTNEDAVWGYAMIVFGQGALMTFGGYLSSKIGPRITTYIGCTIASVGVGVTHYTIEESLSALVATYGLMFGLGISIAYVPALAAGMRWFPENKGLVNGIVLGGFSLGAFIFTQIQTTYLNPNNVSPNEQGYFTDSSVLERVPNIFVLLCVIYATCQLIGCALLVDPEKDKQEEVPLFDSQGNISVISKGDSDSSETTITPGTSSITTSIENHSTHSYGAVDVSEETVVTAGDFIVETSLSTATTSASDVTKTAKTSESKKRRLIPCYTPKEMLQHRQFYFLWTTFFLNNVIVTYVNSMYKVYGQTFINDDRFLAMVGAVAALFSATGRVLWGWIMDKLDYKSCMLGLTSVLCVLLCTLGFTPFGGRFMFAIWVWCISIVYSGTFAMMPTCTTHMFGITYAGINYGLVFSNTVFSSPLAAILTQTLSRHFGWYGIFVMLATISLISFVVTLFYQPIKRD